MSFHLSPVPLDQPMPASGCPAHKFGGSSLADAEHFRRAIGLLDPAGPQIVVVSAMQGVTDALVALAGCAVSDSVHPGRDWIPGWDALRERHLRTAEELPAGNRDLHDWLASQFDALRLELEHACRQAHFDSALASRIHGLGEVWSARIMHAALGAEPAGWHCLDAREVLVVHQGEPGILVDWNGTRDHLAAWQARQPSPASAQGVVITGFVARDAQGRATTLGRNGSDHSAAIFARLFESSELTIWTDVDGVLSADPRRVPDAVSLPRLSYAEACELAYFGAKVLHPQTLVPVMQLGMPVRIRNSRDPHAVGTWITAAQEVATGPGDDTRATCATSPVKGLSLAEGCAILELAGTGLAGVPGTAERLFAALRDAAISVTMISQGSSEHSICCVVPDYEVERARSVAAAAFADAIAEGQVEGVAATTGIAILAAVGDGMIGTRGVAARLFAGLARARINIRAIAQGASERNISVAIAADDATRALRAAHTAFWLSPRTLSIGLVGPGNVGRALLAQLAAAAPRFASDPQLEKRLDLRLRAVCNSRGMVLAERQLDPSQAAGMAGAEPLDLDRFTAHVRAEHLPHAVIIDCSGSDAVAAHYPQWLAAGIHVVTPGKHAGSGDMQRYRAIRAASRDGGQFRYEASVGAGLPVIQTLRSLLDTGDELLSMEGVLSGTLAWLFNRFDGSVPFSDLLREAHALGYTEPDPREDLSGIDVARKLVILAREAGGDLSLEDVEIDNLVPPDLREVGLDEFLARLHELDAPLLQRLQAARAEGRSLRHLASLDCDGTGRARVGVVAPAPGHASMHSRLTDNLTQFRTRRYADNPLVVQGPGAGPEVTAAGVFGDVLAIAQSLGGRF